jgi:hypothetical protein
VAVVAEQPRPAMGIAVAVALTRFARCVRGAAVVAQIDERSELTFHDSATSSVVVNARFESGLTHRCLVFYSGVGRLSAQHAFFGTNFSATLFTFAGVPVMSCQEDEKGRKEGEESCDEKRTKNNLKK